MPDLTINDQGEIDLTQVQDSTPPIEDNKDNEQQTPDNNISSDVADTTSSLTPDTSTQNDQIDAEANNDIQDTPVILEDQQVLSYLSEKLGKTVESFDGLLREPEVFVDPLAESPDLKAIYDWQKKTGRPVSDFLKYSKDYDGMDDTQAVREFLQYKYPTLSPEELNLEMSSYISSEEDLEQDKALKSLKLKKDAVEARETLNSLKINLENSTITSLPKEAQEAVDFYKNYKSQESNQKAFQEDYNNKIKQSITNVEALTLKLGEDTSLNFVPDSNSKNSLQDFMQMPHWYNEDGSYKHSAVVEDSFLLQNKDQIFKLIYEQGLAKGKEEIDKTSRNITLDGTRQTMANSDEGGDKIIVEGAGNMSSPFGTKIRFGNKYKNK